jgi:hypothetical protein
MKSEAQRGFHRPELFDAKVAAPPKLREDLDEISGEFVDRERARFDIIGHRAILKRRAKAEARSSSISDRLDIAYASPVKNWRAAGIARRSLLKAPRRMITPEESWRGPTGDRGSGEAPKRYLTDRVWYV